MQIKLSPLGNKGIHAGKAFIDSTQAWPKDTALLQGGMSGIVFSVNGNYRTAFVEASLNSSFYRGEGSTIEEAELACWNKYVRSLKCLEHEWETRGYTNGAGFCKHCNKFEGERFTGEQLGLFCGTCGVGTTYGVAFDTTGTSKPFCELHIDSINEARFLQLTARSKNHNLTDDERRERNSLSFILDYEDEED